MYNEKTIKTIHLISTITEILNDIDINTTSLKDMRRQLEKTLGMVENSLDERQEDIKFIVKHIIKSLYPLGLDIVVETTGNNTVKETACDLTSNEGKTVFVGVTRPGDKVYIDSTPLHFGKKLVTSYGGSCNPSYDIPRLIKLEQVGNLDLDGMITHEFSLKNINDAFKHMLNNRGIRSVLKMI